MRRRNSACSIFSALLVLAGSTGSAEGPLHQSGSSPPQRLTAGAYLASTTPTEAPPTEAPPPQDAPSVPVTLPARFGTSPPWRGRRAHWVRLSFQLRDGSPSGYAIYLPYVAPRAAVYVNGTYLGESEEFGVEQSDTWNYPLLLPLPAALVRAGSNELLIEMISHGRAHSRAELAPVWVGSRAPMRAMYQRRLWLQVIGVEVVSLLVGLIGASVGLLWLRRPQESLFGLFALSCGIWIIRNAQFFIVHTSDLFSFAVITDGALFWLVAVLYTLSFRALGKRFPKIEAALYAYALLATLAMYAGGPDHKSAITAAGFAALLPVSLIYQVYLTRETLRAPTVLRALLWLAAMATSASGAYDFALMLDWIRWPAANLMPYSALSYAVPVGWALIDRFVKSHNEYERLNAVLEARVKERERALAVHYAHTTHLERERAIAEERDRILRDMHDGLGLQLISARQLVEKGSCSNAEIAAALGDAMDELRIAIDSLKPDSRDLLLMLGNLRYRLEPRLSAAGITLHWDVASFPELERLSPTEAMEVTRIVQEVFTNAMKHSHASAMRLTVRCASLGAIVVAITDNGRGFDASAARSGEGISNMRRRARRIGARIEIASCAGETRTTLTLARLDRPIETREPVASSNR